MENLNDLALRLPDVAAKEERLRDWLARTGLDAAILTLRDNVAWITSGADAHVVTSVPEAVVSLVLTADGEKVAVAYVMDGPRILEEEIAGLGYRLESVHWDEGTLAERCLRLVGSRRAGADTAIPGTRPIATDLPRLHYPLTELDMRKYRVLAEECDRILIDVARQVRPGDTERSVAARLAHAYTDGGFFLDVLLIGSDERIDRFRHPLPTDKRIEKYLLMHPAARKWGLHANITRSLHFGPPPAEVARRYDIVCEIHARVVDALLPGESFAEILELQRALYCQFGCPDEIHNHFQGGITGYLLADTTLCRDERNLVSERQAFDYFITVAGAKYEELTLVDGLATTIASAAGHWPLRTADLAQRQLWTPDLLVV